MGKIFFRHGGNGPRLARSRASVLADASSGPSRGRSCGPLRVGRPGRRSGRPLRPAGAIKNEKLKMNCRANANSFSGRGLRGTPACKSSGPPRGKAAARRSLRDRFCLREACSCWSWWKCLLVKSVAARPEARSHPRAEGCNSRPAGPLMHARPLGCGHAWN